MSRNEIRINTVNTLRSIDNQIEECLSRNDVLDDSIIVEATKQALLEEEQERQKQKEQEDLDFSQLMREADNDISETDLEANYNRAVVPKAKILSDDSFSVEVFLPQTTLRCAMDNISNPDLLRVWCCPVINVFVTKESGASSSSAADDKQQKSRREYDGEWVEGAATLRQPAAYTIYNMFSCIKTYLGFSTHGKISLFTERARGKLTLTLGPLGGVSTICHAFTLAQQDRGVIVTDVVSLQHANHRCWSSIPIINRYISPTIHSHMDQTLVSMEDMRILIEHGETAVEAVGSIDSNGVTPLLGGPTL